MSRKWVVSEFFLNKETNLDAVLMDFEETSDSMEKPSPVGLNGLRDTPWK